MIWYLEPEYHIQYLTDRIQVQYNSCMIAFVDYTEDAKIRNIWVAQPFRQRGVARHILHLVERQTGIMPTPMPPVSDLGRYLFS